MMQILYYTFLLIGAFYILVKSADYLLSTSSILGQRMGLSKFVIGLTIVAIGTSLPELFTAISGVLFSDNADSFVIGTIIGSNISNILLIFGLLILFSKNFKCTTSVKNLSMLFLSTLAIIFLIIISQINLITGIIFLAIYIMYIYSEIKNQKKEHFEHEIDETADTTLEKKSDLFLAMILLLSIGGLNFSSRGVIYGIENIAILLSIPTTYLTLTTVAFATSLPEVIVTYQSAKRRQYSLAIGNIIGSNISNVFMILGVIGIITQFNFNAYSYLKSLFMLIIATIIFIAYLRKKKLKNLHGIIAICLYIFYIISTFYI